MSGGWTANTVWAKNGQYDFAGRMVSLQTCIGIYYGAAAYTTETDTWNVNGQMTSQHWDSLSDGIQYGYSATQNNGQITQATDTLSGETIGYQYDALKRLTSASSTPNEGSTPAAWAQTYQYDGFGNLTAKVLNGTTTTIAVTAATNRLTNAVYDPNGNMTSGLGAAFSYDGANRIRTSTLVSGATEYYGYAPDSKRIYKRTPNGYSGRKEWTFYGAFGEKLGVFGLAGGPHVTTFSLLRSNVWFAGKLISEDGNSPFASGLVKDRLGTNRAGGARYYPYGEEIGTASVNDRTKFATYTRDGFTGLDYADQRYYAATYGRFNTPDRTWAGADTSRPGSLNRYAYVEGDPTNLNDPRGLFSVAEEPDPDPQVGAPPSRMPTQIPVQKTYDQKFTRKLQKELQVRISQLGDCTRILGGVKVGSFAQVAANIQFFDGVAGDPGAGRSEDSIVRNGSFSTLSQDVAGSRVAVTLTDQHANALPDVVIGRDYVGDASVSQADVLLHEALHVALNLDDTQLKGNLYSVRLQLTAIWD